MAGSGARATWLLRIGLAMGVPFALVMTAYLLLSVGADGRRSGGAAVLVLVGVAGGFVFGVGMAVVMGAIDGRRRRRTGVPFSASTRAHAEVVVAAPPDVVGPWAWEVLRRLGREPTWDDASCTLAVSTRVSWWSYGERVSVRLGDGRDVGASPGTTWVEVGSRPRVRTQVVDYGANQVRVRDVVDALVQGPGATGPRPARS